MKKRTPTQYAEALYEVTNGRTGKDLSAAVQAFVELLRRDRKLSKVHQIAAAFKRYTKKVDGIIELDVTFAREPKKALLKAIEDAFGANVEMTTHVNEDILGGMIVKTEDTILDASVETRLKTLTHTLTT